MAKRRASGEGNIRKRSDGRWEGRYVAGHDKNGKPIRKNVLGKTQAEVREKLRQAIAEAQMLDIGMTVSRILHQSSHIFCRRREAKI